MAQPISYFISTGSTTVFNPAIVVDNGIFTMGPCPQGQGERDGFRACTVEVGDPIILEVTPKPGWIFDRWERVGFIGGVLSNPPGTNFNGNQVSFPMPNESVRFRAVIVFDASTLLGRCLTVNTDTLGGYWTGHPNPTCTGDRRIDESCAGDVSDGQIVSLTAFPDSNYQISGWHVETEGASFSLNPPGDPSVAQTASFTYDSSYGDVTITVSFISALCNVVLLVGSDRGTLFLKDPPNKATFTKSTTTVSIDALAGDSTSIRVQALPDSGFSITGWTLDGVAYSTSSPTTTDPPNFSTVGFSERTIIVDFETSTPCTPDKQLTITIVGQGTVSTQDGLYCDIDVLNILPSPANGWVFSRWDFTAAFGLTRLANNVLQVAMTVDRENITAIFVEGGTTGAVGSFFYCPSENYKNNIVSFDFTNSLNDNNPSVDNLYHFRVNFYADVDKTKLIYSAFSLADNKRWFLNDGAFSQLSSEGIDVDLSETVSIVYDPEVLPSQIIETQKLHLINNETVVYEKPLICGIKYYVEIQAYEVRTNTILGIMTIPLMLSCDRIDSYYWNYNKDKNNWLCSGQGKTDLKVCGGFGQAINSSIDSNLEGTFKIVWQGRKVLNNIANNNIYSAIWDSNKDILYSSGQGLYDVLEMDEGNHPVVITDPALNFYITSTTKDNIKYKACPVTHGNVVTPVAPPIESTFEAFCYPGESTLLSSSYDEIKMRVYKEDVSGSLTVNNEKAVSIVNKKSIRLDVDGIVGAYSVRIRNMEDPEWGEWINIDNKLLDGGVGDDENHDAYRVDNNRFLVQWDIQNYNGLRRICCQVLTMYGISNTFCIEVLANFDVPQHVFKFYTGDPSLPGLPTDSPPGNEFPLYNGQYVLSIANAIADSTEVLGGKIVYFDAVFSDPVYKDETKKTSYEVVDGVSDVKFNFIQQGINDKRKVDFDAITDVKFSGKFEIFNSDGIFNKDGASFIEIVFPESSVGESCGSDERDKYNFINADVEEISNIDLLPEEVYQKYQRDRLSKALDINEFKQNYDGDDANFKFGDPGYYRK